MDPVARSFRTVQGIYWLAGEQLASQKGLYLHEVTKIKIVPFHTMKACVGLGI
jgi:hypothetical protein